MGAGLELQPLQQVPVAPALKLELQTHQKHNVARFLDCVRYGDGGILIADDLGLGKTCSSLACVEVTDPARRARATVPAERRRRCRALQATRLPRGSAVGRFSEPRRW